MLKLLGILGGFCFAYCGVPTAYATIRKGQSVGTPIAVALMIFLGAMAMYGYLLGSYGFDLVLTINYGIEILSWGAISFYHFFPQNKEINGN